MICERDKRAWGRWGWSRGVDREGSTSGFVVVSSWVRPVKMGMLFIIHKNSFFSFSILVYFLFCFLHFTHKTWMYDTIRFNQGFIIFNHYNLSVGLCLCVRASVCVRVSVCLCVRLRLYVWVYLQVSAFMCVRVRPRSHIQYFLFRFTALMFRNH